jgi:dephospho-CoA kinase
MLKVGLTGGIASGKTTIAQLLVEKGAYHIDFDELAHEVERMGTSTWQKIVQAFGQDILHGDGSIDRKKLGAIVFSNPERLQLLNKIVHPAVIEEWRKRCDEIGEKDGEAIILSDVPLLFEAGLRGLFDFVILIYSPPELQIKRLMERNGLTEGEAKIRLAAQMPIKEKIPLADYVFDNSAPLNETLSQVDSLWEELRRLGKKFFCKGEATHD